MRAIILAAGRGHRLRDVTGHLPKCLALLGGQTLLERQIAALERCDISEIVVVTGFRADEVRRACGRRVRFLHNVRYASTNSLYSLWLARHLLPDGFVVLNCDVLFHHQMLVDLVTARYDDALLVAGRENGNRYGDEEMKVRVRGGMVTGLAKTMDPDDADGENVGIAKFGADGAQALTAEMTALVAAGGTKDWLPAAFDRFCRRRPLRAVDHRGYPWIEIDFPEDYRRACTDILPALEDDEDAICMSSSTACVNARSRLLRIPVTSIPAGFTARP